MTKYAALRTIPIDSSVDPSPWETYVILRGEVYMFSHDKEVENPTLIGIKSTDSE